MMQTSRIAIDMPTSLRGISNRALREKKARFTNLYRLLNVENLHWCFKQLHKNASAGVDGVTFREYEENLETNLKDLVQRLKEKRYRAKLVRRVYIPKGGGKSRPLGIPALEDKLLQFAVSKILSAIYERDFLDCSWGYRPNRGPREASRQLAATLYRGWFGWVVEADIQGFFDNIDHNWLMKMIKLRVNDNSFSGLIVKWLKAGVLDTDSKVIHSATGTPQGGIVSPILANIYLHHVLDLWFDIIVKKHSNGECAILRYADDFVCAFRYWKDAKRFLSTLPKRLGKFGLKVAEDKTKMLQFSRWVDEPNEAFDFLGFEFRWVRGRNGEMGVRRRTSRKKLQSSIQTFKNWIKEYRHCKVSDIMKTVRRKFQGYWNYYGVVGNMKSLSLMFMVCSKILFKWLNRRSNKRSYTWKGFYVMLQHFQIRPPRIMEKSFQY